MPRPPRVVRPSDRAATAQLLGHTTPRIATAPLVLGRPGPCGCGCALTTKTTLGFDAIKFAEDFCGLELLPWQRWWLIHAFELRPDGTFRFRTVLTLVARQNGKTELLKVVALYMLYSNRARLVLGAAQTLDIAREAWSKACDTAQADGDLRGEIDTIRRANGEQALTLLNGARYKICAATRSAGRGLSVDVLNLDELREQRDWDAWGALTKTTMARPNALILGISNAGDDQSVVLNNLRASAIDAISRAEAGDEFDASIGILEWSAPDNCELDDPEAWAAANPGLGYTITAAALASALASDPPAVFRTENLCQRVNALDSAVDVGSWQMCADPASTLESARDRVVACVDVAPDGAHVTLALAAVTEDDRVRVEVAGSWPSTATARTALPALIERIKPAAVGWFSAGPAREISVEMRAMEAEELNGAIASEACMDFAGLVTARRILHPSDELLDAHVIGSSKLRTGDGWRFTRRGVGHVDAAYAAAGAVRLARTLPPPKKKSWIGVV